MPVPLYPHLYGSVMGVDFVTAGGQMTSFIIPGPGIKPDEGH